MAVYCSPAVVVGGAVVVVARGLLLSQRPTVALVGKKRERGSCRCPQASLLLARCWRPNSTRPSSSLRAVMRAWLSFTARGLLLSQRPVVALVGKKRERGSCRCPQASALVARCWRPNSMRPSSSLRAVMRTCSAVALSDSCPAAGEATSTPAATISPAATAAAARQRRLTPRCENPRGGGVGDRTRNARTVG